MIAFASHDSGANRPSHLQLVSSKTPVLKTEVQKPTARWIDTADAAKLIRKELKAAFPSTVFSVRSSRYAGGSSISIRYLDGPSVKRVEAITGKFEGSYFDGMQDMKVSNGPQMYEGELVRFGVDYVQVHRDESPRFVARVVMAVADYWRGFEQIPAVGVSRFENRTTGYVAATSEQNAEARKRTGLDWSDLVHRAMADQSSVITVWEG